MLYITLYKVFITESWIIFERNLSKHPVFSSLSLYDAIPVPFVGGQVLFSIKKQFRIKDMIHYAEISTEHQTTQMLTVGRSSAPENAGGSESVSLGVVARQSCGAAGSGDERLYRYIF